ncbi:YfhO family protein [Ruminococcus flavefaciens]|uniref:YfhO family protein n=1 Tax=Ruminococcus flavefaciens TaxID=1265 RepID=UPI0004656441|nr:YfhO family protein [Ruminococcus flavefaciens]
MNKEEKRAAARLRWERFKKGKFYGILYDKGLLYFFLSFLIPFCIFWYALGSYGVHPFGDRQILVVDLWHQYYPFFRVVREKLVNGGSFLYSWENGLGTNFLSLISYYAASPLNWLSVFFDDDHVRDALTFILSAKIGFAGAFFSTFLRYTYKRRDFSICMFSVMYALCSYTLGYYWNVMWFDTVALFPLVMLGIVALCREGKWKLYTLALMLSLVANYYIGYFTCIFSVFMFAAASIIECRGIKDWFRKLFLMVRSSVIGVGLGGFMLLPAYFGLKLTYSVNNTMPHEISFYEDWRKIFAHLLSYDAPTKVDGLPNFACGMLAVLLFGVFLFSFGIKIREKIASLLMLALIAVSCNMNILNFIWHGFHFTNQIPYRFAFIFSFVLAAAGFRAFDIILSRGIKIYQLVLMVIAPVTVFVLNYYAAGKKFEFEGALKSSIIITGAFWLIFIAAKIFPFKTQKMRNALMTLALSAAVFSEFIANAQMGVKTVDTTGYSDYPTCYEEIEELLDCTRKTDKTLFYRTEVSQTYTLNDSALYGYYGLSQFSSAANVSVTTMCKRLGLYASEAGNRYYYRTSTPVVNSLLGIKYLIKKDGMLNSEEWVMENIQTSDGSNLYENRYPLGLGYMVDENILRMEDNGGANPFEYQNELIRRASGVEDKLFVPQPVALVEYDGLEITKNGYGNYTFQNDSDQPTGSVTYTYDCIDGGYLYGYANGTGGTCDSLEIKCGDVPIDSGKLIESYPIVFPMGNGQAGESSTVRLTSNEKHKSGNFKIMVYALNKDTFEKAYCALADEQLQIRSFKDTDIIGSVDAKKDGIMFLSIPHEKGWSVYIDGEKAETFKLLQAMTGVRVSAGRHNIELKYTPEGFPLGVAISFASLVLFVLCVIFERRRRIRRQALAAEAAAAQAAAQQEENPYRQGAAIYDQLGVPRPEDHIGRVEDSEVVLYDGIKSAEKEADNAQSESDDSLQRH